MPSRTRPKAPGLRNVAKRLPPEMREVRERLRYAVSQVNRWAMEEPAKFDFLDGSWDPVEAEVVEAVQAGDVNRSLRAVEAWEDHAREMLKGS